MDNQEAKFILKAYRAGGADADDPLFRNALEQARRDPSLSAWLAQEQARDQAIGAKLRAVPVPPGLRDAILAGARVGARPRAAWRHPGWMALAAAIVVAFGVTFLWRQTTIRRSMDGFATFVTDDLRHGRHGGSGEDVHQLQAVLSNPATVLAHGLDLDPQHLRQTGCRTLTFAGRDVMEICFSRGGSEFHLYVMVRDRTLPAGQGPRFASAEGASAAVWTDKRFAYAVASTDLGALHRLL